MALWSVQGVNVLYIKMLRMSQTRIKVFFYYILSDKGIGRYYTQVFKNVFSSHSNYTMKILNPQFNRKFFLLNSFGFE